MWIKMSTTNDDFYVGRNYVDTQIKSDLQTEAKLRAKHPALKVAWEQYQIVLSLVLTEEDK